MRGLLFADGHALKFAGVFATHCFGRCAMNAALSPQDLAVLSPWATQLARAIASLSSDIAMVLDKDGVITDLAQSSGEPLAPSAQAWLGKPLADVVTGETRSKIQLLLDDVSSTGLARRREVSHLAPGGAAIPVSYTAIRLGPDGPVLAVGRDLRAIAAIQQRFLDAQQDIERGYWRARQAESRYRLLFQVATDGVLVVDGQSLAILEANQAAAQLFDLPVEQLLGRQAVAGFELHSRVGVEALLVNARASGKPAEIHARLVGRVAATNVSATPFRTDDGMRLMVRVRAMDGAPASVNQLNNTLARLVDGTQDGVVVTDSAGRILLANPAFLQLVHQGSEAQVRGSRLPDWLAHADGFDVMLRQVREQGMARRIQAGVRSGAESVSVHVTAALLTEGDQECIGFTFHDMARETVPEQDPISDALQEALQALAGELGAQPLASLQAQAQDMTQRFFLSLALRRAQGDVQLAARQLGVDPQLFGGLAPAHP
jgi:transcriptional regulator PpsR